MLAGTLPPPCELAAPRIYEFVEIEVPKTPADALNASFDLDGDALPDNLASGLYQLLLDTYSARVNEDAVPTLAAQQISWQIRLEKCVSDPYARLTLVSNDSAGDLDSEIPAVGSCANPRCTVADGIDTVPLTPLFDPSNVPPDWVPGAALTMSWLETDGVLTGKLGIGLEINAAQTALTRAASRLFGGLIAEDDGCPDACVTDAAQALLSQFDENSDGRITEDEIAEDGFIRSWLAADIDLWDSSGAQPLFWPRRDGLLDAMSLAFEFVAAPLESSP